MSLAAKTLAAALYRETGRSENREWVEGMRRFRKSNVAALLDPSLQPPPPRARPTTCAGLPDLKQPGWVTYVDPVSKRTWQHHVGTGSARWATPGVHETNGQ